ncbi:MAG: M1 family metallopeptidase [Candidatus Aminicenantes bacterium]|nr:M1 family metallopeptidase [Candidatus Aminicenantes bacterium]
MKSWPVLGLSVLLLVPAVPSAARPPDAAEKAPLSDRVVRYDIRVKLDPASKRLEGRELLSWRNTSLADVSTLPFHLYLNAFKNNRTTFMRESGGSHRGFERDPSDWGWVDVKSIRAADGTDLFPFRRFIRPDDGNPDDETVMEVALPKPVPAGGTVELEVAFEAKLPRVFARSGHADDFFMVGQWFPKIGVLKDGAWNCHQYHADSEFFADFGSFRVEITVPAAYVVGATGPRTASRTNDDGTMTYTHVQDDVHDFAWTACPDFVEFRERFVLDAPPVSTEMIFLVHRSHLGQKERYFRALRQGLEFYSRSYGAYPYETVTLVDPAPGASGAGGMEYPTLFTADTWSFLPSGIRLPELVTIHEFGHGYWYGMVASNEFEEAWLDEGITTYSEVKAMDHYYGPDRSMFDLPGLKIGDLTYHRLGVIGSGRFDPVLRRSWDFVSGGSYALNVYSKAGLALLTLEKILGEEVMARVMRTYFERWKFRHPTSEDFFRTAEEASGRDLRWFFDQAFRSPDKLDYAVSSLSTEETAAPQGRLGGEAGPAAAAGTKAPAEFRSEVVVWRAGEWVFPQEVEVVFADGTKVRENWDGGERWRKFVYVKPAKVLSAAVDPDFKYLLDINWANNSKRLDPPKAARRKYTLGLAGWVQHLLSLFQF